MTNRRAATEVRKTPNFDFIFGRYSDSKRVIPYFQISMSFSDAGSYLKLVNEMPGAASMDWRIEELFQRDIDWKRVEKRIVPYLKQQHKAQFFNSLTIALLPMSGGQVTTFCDGRWQTPTLENAGQFDGGTRDFGPIQCGYWGEWSKPWEANACIGQLCWNTEEICGIAIDGQHRLAAIKEMANSSSKSRVPVILIVLSPELGYAGETDRSSVISTLRELFIDLNKHAQKVSRARQILLDDRDPTSICVRELVGKELKTGGSELEAIPPRVPLSLVDWHSEQAKFDDGPYLATILGMDWIVANILGIRPFEDPMAFSEIEKLIGKLENKLDLRLDEARDRLKECEKYDRPFAFIEEPENELEMIAEGFAARWARPAATLLSRLGPYKELIEQREIDNTLAPEFANWYSLRVAADSASGAGQANKLLTDYEKQLENRPSDQIASAELNEALRNCVERKKKHPLAFTVVFQRALVLAYIQFTKVNRNMIESLSNHEEEDIEDLINEAGNPEATQGEREHYREESERAIQLVDALNHLFGREGDFLTTSYEFVWDDQKKRSDRFWLCSFVQPEGSIDFSQAASKRASDILLLVALFRRFQVDQGLGKGDFDDLIERAKESGEGIELKLQQCLNRMCNENSIAGRILKSRDQDVEDVLARWEEIRGRAAWLWAKLAE